jgi:hypothetical protein
VAPFRLFFSKFADFPSSFLWTDVQTKFVVADGLVKGKAPLMVGPQFGDLMMLCWLFASRPLA